MIQSQLSASSALMTPSSFKKLHVNRLARPRVKRSARRRNPVQGARSQKKKIAPNPITENLAHPAFLPRQQQPCSQFAILRTPPTMSRQNFPPEPIEQFQPLPPYAPPPPQYFQQFQPHSYLPQQFQVHPHSYPTPTAPPAPYYEPHHHPAYNGPPMPYYAPPTPYAPPQSRAFNGSFYAPPPPPYYQPQPPQTFLPQVPRDFAPMTPQRQYMFQPFSGGLDGPSRQTRPWNLPSDFRPRL